MKFRYLGELFEIPKEQFNLARPRRTLAVAKRLEPLKDFKSYTFWLYSYYNEELLVTSAYSTQPRYLTKFRYLDIAKHLEIKNLNQRQCKYLTSIINNDIQESIKIIKEAQKTIYEIS